MSEKIDSLEKFRQSRLSGPDKKRVPLPEEEKHEFGERLYLSFDSNPIPHAFSQRNHTAAPDQPLLKEPIQTEPPKNSANNQRKKEKLAPQEKTIPTSSFDTATNYWKMVQAMPVEGNWLTEQSAAYIESCKGSCPFSAQELTQSIYRELQSNKKPIELQSSLFEILGDNSFEFIEVLLAKRLDILTNIRHGQVSKPSISPSIQTKKVPYGASVTIQSEEERIIEKLKSKELKKQQRKEKQGDKSDLSQEQTLNMRELREKRQQELSTPLTLDNLHEAGTLVDNLLGTHTKIALPEGTKRVDNKTCEEYSIPHEEPIPLESVKLVPISAFDAWAQAAFPKYQTLNRIQSKLFETAYKSNENLLICAPTGYIFGSLFS